MHLTSSYKKDFRREKDKSGSYEWWYFDAYNKKNNLHFVIIFYDGCPFSPDYIDKWENPELRPGAKASNHPAISISVYQSGKPVFYSLIEYGQSDLVWDEQKCTLKIGRSSFRIEDAGDRLVYQILLDEKLPGGDHIQADLQFSGLKTPLDLFGTGPDATGTAAAISSNDPAVISPHEWNLCLPAASVTGSLTISHHSATILDFQIDARGYHDHNIGSEPMKQTFSNWYWGRLHLSSGTIVFYIMKKKDGLDKRAWFISSDNSGIELEFDEAELQDFRSNFFMLKSARKITLKSKHAEIMIQMSKIVDSGPFYYRFLCDGIFKSDTEGHIEIANGVSEFLDPARIHQKLFRPLVNMRYTYSGRKPHWVQRYPILYRWTW